MDPVSQALDELWHFALPVLTFVVTNVAWFSLTLRNSLTDVLPEDYMLTAAAKGLTERMRLRVHALPNARLPLVTASALYFGWVVSGAIVVENVFGINGLGALTWDATTSLDFPLMSVGAPILVGPYPSQFDRSTPFQSPTSAHPLGTDWQGFDILKLVMYGGQISLLIGFVSSFVAMVIGTSVGLVAGYYGRVTDQV